MYCSSPMSFNLGSVIEEDLNVWGQGEDHAHGEKIMLGCLGLAGSCVLGAQNNRWDP